MARALTPARSASSACDNPAAALWPRSNTPNRLGSLAPAGLLISTRSCSPLHLSVQDELAGRTRTNIENRTQVRAWCVTQVRTLRVVAEEGAVQSRRGPDELSVTSQVESLWRVP